MPEQRRKFDAEFREGAVRLVRETGKPIAVIARDLGVNEGTLGNWVVKDKAAREGVEGLSRDDAAELKRLRAEVAEFRCDYGACLGELNLERFAPAEGNQSRDDYNFSH